MRVGIVGCGNISGIYLDNLCAWDGVDVVGCADIDSARAIAVATRYGVRAFESVEALIDAHEVELVLNLTTPGAHFDVAERALRAGKHAYNEKPLALERSEGAQLVALAASKHRRLGCAPDTFMGAGIQSALDEISRGTIGKVVAGQAFMMCHGHESWHPDPEFYYKPGGGPLLDMGPYYLTALVVLLGPIESVSAVSRRTFPTRTITSERLRGTEFEVDVETHVAALLEFTSGAVIELTMSFDVWHHDLPPITLHGTLGSIRVGDPNGFGDNVFVRNAAESAWQPIAPLHNWSANSRGLGVLDIAEAERLGRPHRASGDLAFHVLDTMHTILESAAAGRKLSVVSSVTRPSPMPRAGEPAVV